MTVEITVRLTLDRDLSLSDVSAVIDEMDYNFVHDAILDTEIIDLCLDDEE